MSTIATIANVRHPSFGGLSAAADVVPHGAQRLAHREADPAARERGPAEDDPREADPDHDADEAHQQCDPPVREREAAHQAPERRRDRDQDPGEHERRHADLARAHDLDECLRVEARGTEQLQLGRVGRRLHLARPVEVPHLRDDVLHVRDDEVARDEPDEPADHVPERPQRGARLRAVEAVPTEALERFDQAAVIRVEAVGAGERRPSRELREHLALARRGDLELVEERRDRVVVAGQEPEPLERVVDLLLRDPRHVVTIVRRRYASRSMSGWGLYFAFLIPPMIIGFVVQHWLKKTVAAQMQVGIGNGLTGAEVARQILDRNGLQGVPVEPSPGGPLSDHYDPRKQSVHLSEPVYAGRSVASTAIAAHEVGHAIQHEKAYGPFRLRSAMWPAVAFASQAWLFILMIGALRPDRRAR